MSKNKKPENNKSKRKEKALSPEWLRIEGFFDILGEDGPADELWKMLKLALIADNDNSDGRDRSNMLFLYENSKELFEDIWNLLQAQKKKLGSNKNLLT